MCVRLLTTFLVASDLFVLLLYYFEYYFVCIISISYFLNFLHCFTGQKLMLLGRCILSFFSFFPFIFNVYLVYDFIINIERSGGTVADRWACKTHVWR